MPNTPPQLAYLTADMPGIGGTIKQRPEDFTVTELPLYEPCGSGEHLYLYVERVGMTTMDVIRRMAKALNIKERSISYAGLKDRRALTRQHFSIHMAGLKLKDHHVQSKLEDQPFKILWAERHNNKLRRGHLAGNFFEINIRDVQPTSVIRAKAILDQLVEQGIPNYFGEQRFGYLYQNHLVGRALVKRDFQGALDQLLGNADDTDHPATFEARQAYDEGDYKTAYALWPRGLRHERQALSALSRGSSLSKAIYSIAEQQRKFFGSAVQSYLFNQVLEQRVIDGTFNQLLPGDLAMKHENQSVFAINAEDAALENQEQGRATQGEISPTGPMWGSDLLLAQDLPGKMEMDVLRHFKIPQEQIQTCPLTQGSRRSLRLLLNDPQITGGVDEHGSFVSLKFELGKGSYATVLLRELMKNEQLPTDEANE